MNSQKPNVITVDFTGVGREGEAIEFLQLLRPGGPWVLTAIVPDGGGIETMTAETESEAAGFIKECNGRANLYYSVNPTRRLMTKKAAKSDIAAAEFVWADCDPENAETPQEAKKRYRSRLRELVAAGRLPPPTFIVDSGGGAQILWRLKPRIEFEDESEWPEIECVSESVMGMLGAKAGTQDVCRILRLPGTQNLPDAKKRAAGRVECKAKVIGAADAAHPFSAFPTKQRERDHTAADTKRDDSRSGAAFRAALGMPGASYEEVREALLNHSDPEVRAWTRTKGLKTKSGIEERELHRVYDRTRAAVATGYEGVIASDVVMKPKRWLWVGHLLRGALELLAGIPGIGKSQVQILYIACVTTTKPWPDGSSSGPPANVILLTAEDALDDEVIPRMEAAGVDRSRVYILKKIRTDKKTKRQFLLSEDLEVLKQCIIDFGDVALVAIDPITAYMGKINSHMATEVRGQLGPVKDLAEETGVAFSAITHPPKSQSQRAIDHFIGSQAFIAAGRIGHLCIPEVVGDGDDKGEPTGRILFAHAKHNPSKPKPAWAYRLEEKVVQQKPVIEAPFAVFDKEPVDITADQAVKAASGRGKDSDERNKEQRALQALLLDMLKDGPVLTSKVEEDVLEKRSFSDKQFRQARQELKIEAHKVGGSDGKWWMCLPGQWKR